MTPLVDVALRGAVVVLLALIATTLLRRRSAAFRHAILATALLTAAAMPALRAIAPGWHVPALSGALEEPPAPPVMMTLAASAVPLPVSESVSRPQRISLAALVLGLWVLGAALSLAVLVAGLLRLAWLSSRAERVNESRWVEAVARLARSCGLKRRIVLLRSQHPALLLTWGMVRPEIFLPDGIDDWSDERRHVVLAHELAHIRRSDWVVQIAAEAIRSLYWFNPLIWIACRRLRQESEQACDDAVLREGIAGAEYAAHLLAVARGLHRRRDPWGLAPAMAQSSTLERRIRTMLDAQRIRTPLTRTTAALIVLVVVLAAIPIAGFGQTADAPAVQAPVAIAPVRPVQAQPAAPATQSVPVAPVTAQPVPPASPAVVAPPVNAPRAATAPRVATPTTVTPNTPRAVAPAPAASTQSSVARAVVPAPRAVRGDVSAAPVVPVPAAPATLAPAQVPVAPAAQTGDSSLSGAIADQFGGLMPGVSVTLTDVRTGVVLSTTTDDTGQYRLGGLADGIYVLRAATAGFVTASADVTMRRSSDERRNLTMRIGTVQERITVTGSARALVAVAEPVRQRAESSELASAARRLETVARSVNVVPARAAQPLRIGGNIQPPVKTKDVKPVYPASLLTNGITGTVVAVGTIGVDGTVQNLNAASAHPELADAISTAVRQWQFRPTRLNGTPVETTMTVTADFTID